MKANDKKSMESSSKKTSEQDQTEEVDQDGDHRSSRHRCKSGCNVRLKRYYG